MPGDHLLVTQIRKLRHLYSQYNLEITNFIHLPHNIQRRKLVLNKRGSLDIYYLAVILQSVIHKNKLLRMDVLHGILKYTVQKITITVITRTYHWATTWRIISYGNLETASVENTSGSDADDAASSRAAWHHLESTTVSFTLLSNKSGFKLNKTLLHNMANIMDDLDYHPLFKRWSPTGADEFLFLPCLR